MPSVLLVIAFQDFAMPAFFSCMSYFTGLGLLLFLLGGSVFISRYFPVRTGRALAVIMPSVISLILYLVRFGFVSALKAMTINASAVYSSFVFSVLIAAALMPWDNGGAREQKDKPALLPGMKEKGLYVRKNPIVLAGIAVLLMPVFSGVYFFTMGFMMVLNGRSLGESMTDTALFLFTFLIVTVFHVREWLKQFTTIKE